MGGTLNHPKLDQFRIETNIGLLGLFLEQYNQFSPLRMNGKQYSLYKKHHQKTCSQIEIRMKAKCKLACATIELPSKRSALVIYTSTFLLASIIGFHEHFGRLRTSLRKYKRLHHSAIDIYIYTNKMSVDQNISRSKDCFLDRQYVLNTVELVLKGHP